MQVKSYRYSSIPRASRGHSPEIKPSKPYLVAATDTQTSLETVLSGERDVTFGPLLLLLVQPLFTVAEMPAQITIQDTDPSVCSSKPTLVEPESGTARGLPEGVIKMPEAVTGSSQQPHQVDATTTTTQSNNHVDTSSIKAKYRIQSNPAIPEKTSVYTVKELSANQYAHTDPLTTPIEDCFHWEQEFQDLVENHGNEFYLVVFRSVRRPSADSEKLYFADAAAQEEARLSGGLLKYWYGTLNERRECLAMCIWENREAAIKTVHKPAHTSAMKLTSVMYETYTLERYSLKIDTDLTPTFTPLGSMRG